MPASRLRGVPELLVRARQALMLSQTEFGRRIRASERTIQRWESAKTSPVTFELKRIAATVYPVDRQIAAELAQRAGGTLVSFGIEAPPAPPPAPLLPPPAPLPPARPSPTLAHLARAAICSAAEESSIPPASIRLALQAALQTMIELGLTPHETLEGMKPPHTDPEAKKGKR